MAVSDSKINEQQAQAEILKAVTEAGDSGDAAEQTEESNVPVNVAKPEKGAWKKAEGLETIEEAPEEEESDEQAPAKPEEKKAEGSETVEEAPKEQGADEQAPAKPEEKKAEGSETVEEAPKEQGADEQAPAQDKPSENSTEKNAAEESTTEAEKAKSDKEKNEGGSTEKNKKNKSREDVLRRRLVDKYKNDKGAGDDNDKKEETPKSGKLETAKSVGDMIGKFADSYDNKKDPVKNFDNFKKSLEKKEKGDGEETSDVSDETKKETEKSASTGESPLPVKEMLGATAGAVNNTVGAISSFYGASRSKSRKNKSRGRINGARNIIGAAGSLSGGVGALLNSGKVGKSDGVKTAGSVLNAATGGLSAAGAILGMIGAGRAKKQSAGIAERAEAISKRQNKWSGDTESTGELAAAVKEKKDTPGGEGQENDPGLAKRARDTAKANKLAMGMASKFNREKSKASSKGLGNVITGATQMISGILGAVGLGAKSAVGSILNPVMSFVSKAAKSALDKRDEKNAEAEKKKDDSMRLDTVKEYLEGKREKIKEQAKKAAGASDADEDEKEVLAGGLSDAEADKIALARLGVSVSDIASDKPASDAEFMGGFDKIVMKRANNIMRAFNKDELLEALMLDKDATVEDVAAALKGE